ncbi:MAG: exodeoxyribonuclease VII small subunit [Clostridia bacterium]|nr:exodeoxyribonuclease VII small subunit [Clostridia bacterium]
MEDKIIDAAQAAPSKDEKAEIKFEAALARLEEIVASLERGKCELDESLSLFEEGVSLVKLCTEKLDGAEQKIRILTEDGTADFNVHGE